ncbi:MAG: hypothetical protein QOF01_326 [Thermomicrobiales bacterium]|jgi:hypothetical protein|nr:hypothetical protein [Thermomicrobiales bacterium]
MASQRAPSLAPHLTTNGATPEPGLTRRTLVRGLGGLGALVVGATWAERG